MGRVQGLAVFAVSTLAAVGWGQGGETGDAGAAWSEGNTLVLHPAPRITPGEVPGFGGTPAEFDAGSTGYYFVAPSARRLAKGPVPLLLALNLRGDQDEATPRTGMSLSFLVRPWLYAEDAVFIGLNHGAEDSREVALQRSRDALHDALQRWNVDPARVYVGANDFGARNAVALIHLLPPGFFAGALLSSNAHWGAFDDWSWHAGAYSLFTGEDDASYEESWNAYLSLAALGKDPTLYVAPGLANHGPLLHQGQQMVWELMGEEAALGRVGQGPRTVVFAEVGDESDPGAGAPLVETIAELLEFGSARRAAAAEAARATGATIQERVPVTSPSPIDFGALPAFKSEVPASYDPLEDASYFLYVPPVVPAEGVTLLVGVCNGNDGGHYFFEHLEEHLRERGILYVGANDIDWRKRSFAEAGQRVLDALHDARQRFEVERVLFYGYCGATGLATAVAHALPDVFEGGFLGGGAFPPGQEDLVTTLRVARGVYCYTGGRDWARQDVERAYQRMVDAGVPATLSSAPDLGHVPPSYAEVRQALSWLLE